MTNQQSINWPVNFYDWLMVHKTHSKREKDFIEDSKSERAALCKVRNVADLDYAMFSIGIRWSAPVCTEAKEAGKQLVSKYQKYLAAFASNE